MTKSSCLRMDKDPTESLWVRIKERTGKSDITSVPAAGHLTGKNKQMRPSTDRRAASHSRALALKGDFNHLATCQTEQQDISQQTEGSDPFLPASAAWCPVNTDVMTLQRVEWRATKAIEGLQHLSFEKRLRELGLFGLMRRFREILSMSKIIWWEAAKRIEPVGFFFVLLK